MSVGEDAIAASVDVLRTVVQLTCRAPSVHNTQPWAWRTSPGGLDLYADRGRALDASDPQGRNLVISCGAALHHAQVVSAALGWVTTVTRFPAGPGADHLAHLDLSPAEVGDDAGDVLLAVRERATDRRRFTSWPVPDDVIRAYAREAGLWGAHGVPLIDPSDRFRVDRLADRARDVQARHPDLSREQRTWVEHSSVDGIPRTVVPAGNAATSVRSASRFGSGLLDDAAATLETSDGVVLLCGYADGRPDWLRTGEALSALWLKATLDGLSVVPLSQVVEVEETRSRVAARCPGRLGRPPHPGPARLAGAGPQATHPYSTALPRRRPRRLTCAPAVVGGVISGAGAADAERPGRVRPAPPTASSRPPRHNPSPPPSPG